LIFFSIATFAQVGIGTTTPDGSAKLDVNSTDKGFLPPRLTTAQRDQINLPAVGLMIYNTTLSAIQFHTGGNAWVTASSSLFDTSSLNLTTRFDTKLNKTDTSNMLFFYRIGLNNKLNSIDTTKMLETYITEFDTSNMLLFYRTGLNNKLNSIDTTKMLETYLRKTDTASLSYRITEKLYTSDAAGSYVPYTGATRAVNLGAYDLTVNGLTIGKGASGISTNTAIGLNALYSNTTGSNNTANGSSALYKNTTGSNNTANGSFALDSIIEGSNNTAIGRKAGRNLLIGSNNTMIGYDAAPSASEVNNEITLGNSSITTLRAQATTITALSDRRDKTDIIPIGEGLEFLKKLNPVSFTWNTRDKAKVGIKSAGFIAQELLALQKQSNIGDNLDLVSENNPEKLEARYGNLLPIIVKAIQEESAEKDKEIKALKERINALEKLVNQILNK
jgi:hypothetical protein